jgi:lipoprotein-anchoring transpeptidase ErfK/SrfK
MKEVVRKAIVVQPADSSQSPLYVWNGYRLPGAAGSPLYVTIDLSQQKAYVFKNHETIAWSYVATGKHGYETPPGTYYIQEKQVDKRSNKYGAIVNSRGEVIKSNATAGVDGGGRFVGASMPYWMRLTGYGIGMHAGPIPYPGAPASHGCIRLPYPMAQKLYAAAPSGTRVTVVP